LRECFRGKDHDVIFRGQRAEIRVDAYPNRIFKGYVKNVATIASQADWLSSDVKVYQTIVAIDGVLQNEDLKPGMSAEVIIYADETPTPVLTIPIQSVVGTIAMGEKRKCFVLNEDGKPQERDIIIGMSNEKVAEVREGLKEGEKVVLNPRPILAATKSNLKPGISGGRHGGEGGEEGKEGGKKGERKRPFDKGDGFKEKMSLPNPQDIQKGLERFQEATPEQRKAMLDKLPVQFREMARKKLEEKGIKVD